MYRPDLTLLLGDQVYLDLPAFYPFESDTAWLAERFEEDYVRNWTGEKAYRSVLRSAPTVSIPDDHEYWNNFPHWATIIRTTWKQAGRDRWKAAAARLYEAFQLPAVPLPSALQARGLTGSLLGDPVVLTIPPLSLFILDSRSCREEDRSRSIKFGAIEVLRNWVSAVTSEGHFGVVVTGQSFVEKAAGFWGRLTDYKLRDYDDLDDQLLEIVHLAQNGSGPVVLITGDVHWGRVSNIQEQGGSALHEVISSPTALVDDPRQKAGRAWKAVRGLFSGAADLWPEHHDPPMDKTTIAFPTEPGTLLECTPVHPQKGNHIAMLSFQRKGLGLRMRVAYWSIHEKFRSMVPIRLPDVDLKPRPLNEQ